MIAVGIVGCGRVAKHYEKIILSGALIGCRIVAVADSDISAAMRLGQSLGCDAFESLELLLSKTRLDLLIVLTPSGMHYEHAKKGLEHGVSVLVEKPLSMSVEDASALLKLAADAKKMLCVAYQNRFNPAVIALKNALSQKRFGKIITSSVRVRWCRYQEYYDDGWHGTWAQDGGVINQQAIHHVDALNSLLGPIDKVCSTITRRLNDLEAEDTHVSIVKFKSGALGTIEATTAARPSDFEASLSVVGEYGYVSIGGVALNRIDEWTFVRSHKTDRFIQTNCSQDVPNGYGVGHVPLLQEIIDRLEKKIFEPPVSLSESLETTSLIHALYASDENQGWVTVGSVKSKRLGIE